MYSELECGICYRTYTAGRRCPRELHCKHSFCESCLLVLYRHLGSPEARLEADRFIVCPLCRQTTSISGEGGVRSELRVDECALERLLAAGVLEEEGQHEDGCDDNEEATLPETPGEESDPSLGARRGPPRRFWRKVWRKIVGKSARDDLKNIAMMSCLMF
uniref:RING-type domain-containing protein n=1 Tax=Monopterus albus TaxID=43700 RepID=A0A3Q3Q4C1_MONAL